MDNEARTRAERINRQLAKAGWPVSSRQVIEEWWLSGNLAVHENSGDEFVDYALVSPNGQPLALVEAKRSSRDALEGERQVADYADRVKARHGVEPFIFLANGDEVFFWQRSLYPPRRVSGFFTESDLERLAYLEHFREPLAGAAVSSGIVDRAYQIEAIKSVAERIEASAPKWLLSKACASRLSPRLAILKSYSNPTTCAKSSTSPCP